MRHRQAARLLPESGRRRRRGDAGGRPDPAAANRARGCTAPHSRAGSSPSSGSARHGPAEGSSSPVPAGRCQRLLCPSCPRGAQRERCRCRPGPARAGPRAPPRTRPGPAPQPMGTTEQPQRPSPLLRQAAGAISPTSDLPSKCCLRRGKERGKGERLLPPPPRKEGSPSRPPAHPGDRAPAEAINPALRTRRTRVLATLLLFVFTSEIDFPPHPGRAPAAPG